jgi:hypothetical protein
MSTNDERSYEVSTVDEVQAVALPDIFAACVNKNHARLPRVPFVVGDHIYASDGRIIVRCPRGEHVPDENLKPPPVDQLTWDRPATKAIELPFAEGLILCDTCFGWKTVDYSPCWECDGAGVLEDRTGIKVGDAGISAYFIALLRRHGVVGVVPLPSTTEKQPAPSYWFTTETFQGIVMSTSLPPEPAAG